jgi:hypothetical protein
MNAADAAKILAEMPSNTPVDSQTGDHVGIVLPGGEHSPGASDVVVQIAVGEALRNSNDVAGVVQALANGLRTLRDLVKGSRLSADRVHAALRWLLDSGHVMGGPLNTPDTRFRLTDDGQDMLKEANAAARKRPL